MLESCGWQSRIFSMHLIFYSYTYQFVTEDAGTCTVVRMCTLADS